MHLERARVGGNATVTDPDHLPGPSKVILGNIICVWTISELYLGRIGREEHILVQNYQKLVQKCWPKSWNFPFFFHQYEVFSADSAQIELKNGLNTYNIA